MTAPKKPRRHSGSQSDGSRPARHPGRHQKNKQSADKENPKTDNLAGTSLPPLGPSRTLQRLQEHNVETV
ncbi:hypothetical protein BGZ61DRAFT_469788 [Ilyonectria robusta]|uniref:uncharacterized protein n=1 Tax=Ilyonectria robusta TaxID=1079257 RepID=UPI001E8E2604|nr:uncharacterized protein BGZ61DRAFT_469788 [Ilyonectria robusta]KAH8648126.1 hypothetical protein BGZ61DRAFT_469788 [Ilyonectria robusta]